MESDLPRASTLTLTGFPAEVVDQINARFNPRCRLRVAISRAPEPVHLVGMNDGVSRGRCHSRRLEARGRDGESRANPYEGGGGVLRLGDGGQVEVSNRTRTEDQTVG